jgi:hypothetical protein
MREHAASDKPVAPAISLSENASSFGAISRVNRASSRWPQVRKMYANAAWFSREIVPNLDNYSLSQGAKATELSLAACPRIPAGTRVPHPRHWKTLADLIY